MKRLKENLRMFPLMFGIAAIIYLIGTRCQAQVKDGVAAILQETKLDSLPMLKAQLHDKAKEWAGKAFTSAKDVIVSDTENSIIVRYNNSSANLTGSLYFEHRIEMDFKDHKMRAKIFVVRSSNGYNASDFFFPEGITIRKVHQRWLDQLMIESRNTMNSLVYYMNAKTDDW